MSRSFLKILEKNAKKKYDFFVFLRCKSRIFRFHRMTLAYFPKFRKEKIAKTNTRKASKKRVFNILRNHLT